MAEKIEMDKAKRKQKLRDKFFEENRRCILCGGGTPVKPEY